VALGCALQVNFGQFHPLALAWLAAALAGVALCAAKPHWRGLGILEVRATAVIVVCVAVQFALLLTRSPGATGRLGAESGWLPFRVGAAIAAALCVAGCVASARPRPFVVWTVLLLHFLLGLWVLRAAPNPGVDVCMFQRESAEALVGGENPYAITFKDPYADSARFYGAGVSVAGRLQFGYPYPPLTLLLTTVAHLLGDFRYAQLAAMTLAGGLLAFARPGRNAFAAAALLLFTPRGFFVLEAGWTEPLAVLFLAATVFAMCRAPRIVPVSLGLLLAAKQYLVLALLVAPLMSARRRGWLWKAAVVAGVVTLPLALWDLSAFVHSTVLLQLRQPFREDSLSFLVPLGRLVHGQWPGWIGLVLAIAAGVLASRKLPRTPAGFATGLAFTFLVFFAFNKQAFCNYYYFVIGALCCAVAASEPVELPPERAVS
jgi:hypothetical protein